MPQYDLQTGTASCGWKTLKDDVDSTKPGEATLPEPMEFTTAREGEQVTAQEWVRLNFYLDGYRFSDEFMLIPGLSEAVIVGAATLQKWRMKLDLEADEVIIDPRVTKLRLHRSTL